MVNRWTVGLLVLVAAAVASGLCLPNQQHPNIILTVIDTTRANALSGYGRPPLTTPNTDAIVQKGVLFEQASTDYVR